MITNILEFINTNILKLTSTKLERKKKTLTSTITYHMHSRVHIQNRPAIQKMIFWQIYCI